MTRAFCLLVCRSARRRRPFCFSRPRCGLPLQPDECLRPRRAKEFRPRVRDAFVSPLRDRSRCDAAKISDLPSPAQRVNDCACVHVRHHRACAVRPQGCFALTKNACILFFSALKSSHRSTEHRAAMLFRRPAQQQAPATTRSSKQNQHRRDKRLDGERGTARKPATIWPTSTDDGRGTTSRDKWASSTRKTAEGEAPASAAGRCNRQIKSSRFERGGSAGSTATQQRSIT